MSLTAVPGGGELIIEARVQNRDAGFVREGQPVEVKLEAYPFTRYGVVHHGVIEHIGRDAVQGEKEGLVFPALVKLTQPWIMIEGRRVPLAPGLASTVEIKTGERGIIGFLLSPLARRVKEGGAGAVRGWRAFGLPAVCLCGAAGALLLASGNPNRKVTGATVVPVSAPRKACPCKSVQINDPKPWSSVRWNDQSCQVEFKGSVAAFGVAAQQERPAADRLREFSPNEIFGSIRPYVEPLPSLKAANHPFAEYFGMAESNVDSGVLEPLPRVKLSSPSLLVYTSMSSGNRDLNTRSIPVVLYESAPQGYVKCNMPGRDPWNDDDLNDPAAALHSLDYRCVGLHMTKRGRYTYIINMPWRTASSYELIRKGMIPFLENISHQCAMESDSL